MLIEYQVSEINEVIVKQQSKKRKVTTLKPILSLTKIIENSNMVMKIFQPFKSNSFNTFMCNNEKSLNVLKILSD